MTEMPSVFLGTQPMHHPRKGDRLAEVRKSANPGDGALEAQTEPGVHEGAVFTKVQVPAVCLDRQPFLANPVEELVMIVLTLRAADNLTVPFGSKAVIAENSARVRGVLLHIERLRFLGIVEDEHRAIVSLDEQ